MNTSAIKEDIISMLKDIINRTKYINYHHPQKDLSLDIDLVKDDLRMIYRSFDILKSMGKSQEPLIANDTSPEEKIESQEHEPVEKSPVPKEASIDESAKEDMQALESQVNEESADDSQIQAASEKKEEALASDVKSDSDEHHQEEKPIEAAEEELKEIPPLPPVPDPVKEPEPYKQPLPPVETPNQQRESTAGNSKKSVIDLLSSYSKKTIGDQYVSADNSLNKRISAEQEDKSINTRMQLNPINNIKEVIGLNEKFLFINELFSGDILEYHDSIARLNSMENMQAAFDLLNELSEKHSWDAERSSATINRLATYVQRRYI